ncbi:hypothetical protein WG66_007930 [Moniliophthora roreri]|nr:hypothetical protein WG66_007930 [Moniliophthora roreri]
MNMLDLAYLIAVLSGSAVEPWVYYPRREARGRYAGLDECGLSPSEMTLSRNSLFAMLHTLLTNDDLTAARHAFNFN